MCSGYTSPPHPCSHLQTVFGLVLHAIPALILVLRFPFPTGTGGHPHTLPLSLSPPSTLCLFYSLLHLLTRDRELCLQRHGSSSHSCSQGCLAVFFRPLTNIPVLVSDPRTCSAPLHTWHKFSPSPFRHHLLKRTPRPHLRAASPGATLDHSATVPDAGAGKVIPQMFLLSPDM